MARARRGQAAPPGRAGDALALPRGDVRPFFQGSCWSTIVLNLERLGPLRYDGYPVLTLDLPADPERLPYVYENHPPTGYLAAWAFVRTFAPAGWADAWREGRPPPPGTELVLRLPFFAGHLLALLALWWAVRQGGSAQEALLALAMGCVMPLSIVFANLVNYENLWLAPVLFAAGWHARFVRTGAGRALLASALLFALAASITVMPALFVWPLVLQTLLRRGWRASLAQAAALGAAVVVPIALHAALVRHVLGAAAAGGVFARSWDMLRPLFDGSLPLVEWLRRQALRLEWFTSWPWLLAAAGGLAVAGVRALRRRGAPASDEPVRLGPPLFAAGASVLLLFYRHTWDGAGREDGQTLFLLNLLPGLCALAAAGLSTLGAPLSRLRGGVAPLVVLTTSLALPGLLRTATIERAWRAPGPRDDPGLEQGPPTPLPATAGAEIGALLPPRSIGFYPRGIGFTTATAYYAWRTLLPVDEETWGFQQQFLRDRLALDGLPRYFLIPKHPPRAMEAKVAAIRARLAEAFAPLDESEAYELWPAFD